MRFNANQSITEGQLAALYNSPNRTPEEIDTDLFLNASQGRNYIHKQAANLGIGDPVNYFAQKQLAARMASTPSGFDNEMARLSGNYDLNSLPGQLQNRDQKVNALMAQQAAQAQATQAAMQQHNMSAYPLPAVGAPQPTLSPVMQEAMRQQGITSPTEFLMRQRLGGMATPSMANGEALPKPVSLPTGAGPVEPGRMYNLPEMQAAITQRPQFASTLFEGVTGHALGPYLAARLAADKQQQEAGVASLRKAHESHEIGYDAQGKLQWRQSVMNPSTGKMEATGPLGEGDPYQKSLEQYLPFMDSKLAEFQALAKNRVAPTSAVPNMGTPTPQASVPHYMQAEGDSSNFIANWGRGMAGDLGSRFSALFGGPTHDPDAAFRANALPPARQKAKASLPVLLNNPRFQDIMRKDPAHARRIIQAIQMGTPTEDPYQTPLPAYAEGSFMP